MKSAAFAPNNLPEILPVVTDSEVVRIALFGRALWEETRYYAHGIEYDRDSVLQTINGIVQEGIALYAEAEGQIVGILLVIVAPCVVNQQELLGYAWQFHVVPEYRDGPLGADLLSRVQTQLRKKGVKHLQVIASSKEMLPYYESFGFERTECAMTKVVPWH